MNDPTQIEMAELRDKIEKLLVSTEIEGTAVDPEPFISLFSNCCPGQLLFQELGCCFCSSRPELMIMRGKGFPVNGYWVIRCASCGRARIEAFDLNEYHCLGNGIGASLETLMRRWNDDRYHFESLVNPK